VIGIAPQLGSCGHRSRRRGHSERGELSTGIATPPSSPPLSYTPHPSPQPIPQPSSSPNESSP
jgi:hypothetical protein